ncbi:MAG: hypothetical protein ACYSVY_03240, partial [Planctomycetota bacterium]
FSPVFNVLDTAGARVWVYVDHLIHEAVGRDAGGNVIFQVPGTITGRTLVELVLRGQEKRPS